ncbi:MAG: DNA phosphorothioation-associated putative methyltransferase [Oscillatoriales cyanobacterium SM2_2_1]|nr:DNA phosphorothioation-associated putative methyltransferase [Oscillatoriales cyanobacterium SM2_2_1]
MVKAIAQGTASSFASLCHHSQVGKKLPDALYIHISAVGHLPDDLQNYNHQALALLSSSVKFNLIKFSYGELKISYLYYPDFESDPHPALHSSVQVNLLDGSVQTRNYSPTSNPPILHRKETFVTPNYPHYAEFCELTRQEEALSLLNSHQIGTRKGWEAHLREKNLQIDGHQLISLSMPKIDRHKAAIHRNDLSKPVRLALESDVLQSGMTFYDYGCGHGGDIARLRHKGFTCMGFDPYYLPEPEKVPADVVNLGYVINVIEDPAERREALAEAWKLTQKVLIVSAQVLIGDSANGQIAYGDGVVSSRNTFQKYYQQEELKNYIDRVLAVDSVPVALGIYFVFQDETQAQSFRASRFRTYATTPRVRLATKSFPDYQEILLPLMQFFTERGRLPIGTESAQFPSIMQEFGSIKKAFNLILQATSQSEWDAIADKRRQDILVFLALSNFDNPSKKLKITQLPLNLQTDIKALFGSYQSASTTADLMLFNLGKPGFIRSVCERSSVGWLEEKYLTVHISALDSLDTMLRLYEGCASRTFGRMAETTLIRFHLDKPKIAYMYCPDFDKEPHPKIASVMYVSLRELKIFYQDYCHSENPAIINRKSSMVLPSYPLHEKFNRLTQQEVRWGLLSEIPSTTPLKEWHSLLQKHSASLRGHRLIRNREVKS